MISPAANSVLHVVVGGEGGVVREAGPWPLLLDLSAVELCNKSVRRPV